MTTFRVSSTFENEVTDFPLRSTGFHVTIELDTGDVTCPEEALRNWAIQALEAFAAGIDAHDLEVVASAPGQAIRYSETGLDKDGDSWVQPQGMNLRIAKTAHKIVRLVADAAARGDRAFTTPMVESGHVSGPTMSRFLNTDNEGGAYLAHFATQHRENRRKYLTLTEAGEQLLNLMADGKVPVAE